MKRKGLRIRGIVQGVGFRPFVAINAKRCGLSGFVYNDSEGVYLEVEGEEQGISSFMEALLKEAPPMASIQQVESKELPVKGETTFSITVSEQGEAPNTLIAPDTAPCKSCMEEIKTLGDRRYEYPFINCTDCGPRYTIVRDIPYDRSRTTMAKFSMCAACEREYREENNRRFHAQPNACALCGPHYRLIDVEGRAIFVGSSENAAHPIEMTRSLIKEGYIVAVKGVGGYHLVCDAFREEAVKRLRERKKRPHKPFALMAGSEEAIHLIATPSDEEMELLKSPARPIVLLKAKKDSEIAPSVAPENGFYGVMLGYAPVHALLLEEDSLWVMTSGNRSGTPVLYEDEKALKELVEVADFFLVHDRPIEAPVDDSVLAVVDEKPYFYRRSRGYVPAPLFLPTLSKGNQLLAVGGDLKSAFAMRKGEQVFVSPYIGDLENKETHDVFEHTVHHFERIFSLFPQAVVADQHPSYFSSRFAKLYSKERSIPLIIIQHHHAHIATVMAENGISEPVLGISLDGTGYGEDGHAWGGEFLMASATMYKRLAHFSYEPLPGGEMAVREPWRQAIWYLYKLYGNNIPAEFEDWVKGLPKDHDLLVEAIKQKVPMMQSCGAGRLFDAVGCLLGLGYTHTFEGQVPMALEQLAENEKGYIYEFSYDEGVLDFTPLVADVAEAIRKGVSKKTIAASFHRTLAYGVAEAGQDLQKQYNLSKVVLGGGVWQNRRLIREIKRFWPEQELLLPHRVPPNDGGLSLGQIWIASHMLEAEK